MKILFVSQKYLPHKGGIENSIYHLSAVFSEMGNAVTIITTDISNKSKCLEQRETINNIDVIRSPWHRSSLFFNVFGYYYNCRKFANTIRKETVMTEPGLVVARDIFSAFAAIKAGFGSRMLYIAPSNIVEQEAARFGKQWTSYKSAVIHIYLKLMLWPVLSKMQIYVLGNCKLLVCWSEWLRLELVALVSGVSSTQLNPGVVSAPVNKSDWEVKRNICAVCRLDPNKNIDLIIDAMKYVNEDVKLQLTLAGSSADELQAKIQRLNLTEKVVVREETFDVFSRYDEADIFLLPSLYEPFGQTVVEAMSRGLITVAVQPNGRTIKTASSEIITHGKTGYLVDNTPKAFAAAINEYYKLDSARAEQMAKQCREHAALHYSWSTTAKKILQYAVD